MDYQTRERRRKLANLQGFQWNWKLITVLGLCCLFWYEFGRWLFAK